MEMLLPDYGELTKYVTTLKLEVLIWWRTLLQLNLVHKETERRWSQQSSFDVNLLLVYVRHVPTRYETREVWLDGFELVDIILSLLICDLPRIIVAAGLSLDLIGRCCWGYCSYRCAFLWKNTWDIQGGITEPSLPQTQKLVFFLWLIHLDQPWKDQLHNYCIFSNRSRLNCPKAIKAPTKFSKSPKYCL